MMRSTWQPGMSPGTTRRAAVLFPGALALSLLLGASPVRAAVWTDWSHNSTLAIQNNTAAALPAGYTVNLVLDTAALIPGQMLSDCADLRVSYVGGGTDVELDRLVVGAGTTTTTVTFRTQAAIGASGSSTDYRLHYGNAVAGSPPASPGNVYAFYDDFQDGDAAGWTTKGTWGVVADGGNYVYRYTTGGATWALAYVPLAGMADLDYVAKVRAAASTNWIGLAFRIQDQFNFMTFYESKDVSLFKLAHIASDDHAIQGATPGFAMTAGTWYRLRLQAIGNQVRSRIWLDGSAEPTSWTIDRTDATYQTATNIGATLYNHTTAADWDDITVRRLVATEPTVTVLADEYTLTLSTVGSGSVAKVPDQGTYHYGDVVTLTATAADGWEFRGWSGGLTGNPTTVTIHENTAVTASFGMTVAPWWNSAWGNRAPLTVTNTSGSETLPVGYSSRVTLDAASMVATGRMLAGGADLRIVSYDGLVNTELDRVVENAGTDHMDVWFALPRAIAAGGQDDGYYLYYGNPGAGTPPAAGSNVFLFHEDWEQGTSHWTSAGGLDGTNSGTMGTTLISGLEAVSTSHSQQFPQMGGGGDAFSGYIPVTAGAGYVIGAWGKSATNAYLPVGVDPYSAAYVKGTEIWLWTGEWTVGSAWSQRSARFVAPAGAAFVKIKSEWWMEGPGTAPVYLDDLYLRYALASEPTVAAGQEEGTVAVPTVSNVGDTGPVEFGAAVTVSATAATAEGAIDAVTLRVETPVATDIGMSLVGGDGSSGTWQASFTPAQGGSYTYRVLVHASTGRSTLSASHAFLVTDLTPPVVTLVSVVNPILVRNLQTLTVTATDNGQLASVTVTVDGASHAMTRQGDQYSYTWRVTAVGTRPYTVTATDTGGNHADLAGSFEVQAREVDVCTWRGGKVGAASWSIDDGNSSCRAELESAGIRGTFYCTGGGASWAADYSAAGHEIGSHTVGHPCDYPPCKPNCTAALLWEIPYTEAEVTAYRQDQLDPNIAGIEASTGKPVLSMAWPCGCTDARRMTAAAPYFLGVRGYYDYIAELTWVEDVNLPTPVEFMNLNSSHAYNQAHIDQAIAEGKWAVVTSHGDCSGIAYIGSRQDVLWVAPVGEVLKYIKVRDAARFSNYSRAGRTISFDVTHGLATMTRQQVDATPLLPIVFDNPVTLKVHLLDSDVVAGVRIDDVETTGAAVLTLDGTRYVTFDAALNTSRHVVVTLSGPTPVIDQVADDGPVELGNPVRVTARVTVAEGLVHDVKLHVTAPQAAEYDMTPVGGMADVYEVSFTPGQIASYTGYVSAANEEAVVTQSSSHAFLVHDTTAPQVRSLAQAHDAIPVGEANALGAEGFDLGGLQSAVLATDESGAWHAFGWGTSDWWDHRWAKRVAVTAHEPAGLARVKETIDLAVSSEQFVGLTRCAAELRVADADRQEVPSQVYDEQTTGGTVTCHLVFQADVGAGANRTYYVYYGNPAATAPTYSAGLSSSLSGSALTVGSAYFNLDLDTAGGIVSRVALPAGTNGNLPLSPVSDSYWGWHQVCSSLDGNITGRNSGCIGGVAPASGLVLTTVVDGPLLKVFEFTSVKNATYHATYRFCANAPYYLYDLTASGAATSVLNNFWLTNGYYPRLGTGSGGTPASVYATYDYGADHVRMASFATVDVASIDGTNNDGTQLGATDYMHPTATGLSLCVATAATQAATEDVLARRAAPLTTGLGAVEDAPATTYGSPVDAGGATGWTPAVFTWQNAAIPEGTTVHWRVEYCDATGNCRTTDVRSFHVGITVGAPVAGVAGAPATSGNDASGRTKTVLSWSGGGGGSGGVKVYRKGYGYPLYPGATTWPPATPASPAAAEGAGWALTDVTASGQTDLAPTRDFWSYVAFSTDGWGNSTAASEVTAGTLNYLLGDVTDGTPSGPGDNLVDGLDVSLLGTHYGAASGDGLGDYLGYLDVGPTVGYSTTGRPLPDGAIEFEDLVIFALNFGAGGGALLAGPQLATAGTAGSDALALEVPELPGLGERFTVRVRATAGGGLHALKLELGYDAAVVVMEGAEAGELLGRQGAEAVVLSPRPGRVDVALLGAGAGLTGSGELARVTFRVKAAGAVGLALTSAEGRDGANRKVTLGGGAPVVPALPTKAWLAPPAPNPFHGTTTLSYALAKDGAVELGVYGVDGRRVATLVGETRAAGLYQASWDGRDGSGQPVRPGMYYARLVTPEGAFTRRLVLMR